MIALLAITLVVLAAALFGLIAYLFVTRTARFQRAVYSALPAFAELHRMALLPKGSRDRLPRIEGSYEGVPLVIELFLARAEGTDDELGHRTVRLVPSTRVEARTTSSVALSASVDARSPNGFAVHEGPALLLERAPVARFAASRSGTLEVRGGSVELVWSCAEDELEVLESAATLAAAVANEAR